MDGINLAGNAASTSAHSLGDVPSGLGLLHWLACWLGCAPRGSCFRPSACVTGLMPYFATGDETTDAAIQEILVSVTEHNTNTTDATGNTRLVLVRTRLLLDRGFADCLVSETVRAAARPRRRPEHGELRWARERFRSCDTARRVLRREGALLRDHVALAAEQEGEEDDVAQTRCVTAITGALVLGVAASLRTAITLLGLDARRPAGAY